MEARFKTGDVVVENDINFPMFKMTIEFVFGYYISNYEYQCAFFELGELRRERFREDQLLSENEFIQKRISENRNYKIEQILREV